MADVQCAAQTNNAPASAQPLFELGMALHAAGRETEAVRQLARAGQLAPQSAQVFHGLGCALQKLKLFPQAATAFEHAFKLNPRSNPVAYHLGNVYFALDEISRAKSFFEKAVALQPADFGSWNNLGKCLKELNRLDESLAAYDRALRLQPGYAIAHHGRAMTLLTAGRWREGFAEYGWREHLRQPRVFNGPLWCGENLSGRTLFIHAEQGFGDAIQMACFLPQTRALAGRVILECRPELKTLFQFSSCADTVIAFGEKIPPFDFYLPLPSLPRALGYHGEKWSAPYLKSRAEKNSAATARKKLRVGLVWAGNPKHHQDAQRSMRLPDLAPLLEISGVEFFSLQQPVPERDANFFQSLKTILHAQPPFADFLETADFISTLDLVIAVDTGTAHLAGALGKPVWVLLQHAPDWRWQLGRSDTIWYPTMRLFRQTARNDWRTPVNDVAAALKNLPS